MDISDIIAVIALVIAGLTAFGQLRSNKKSNALQQDFKELQQQSNYLQQQLIIIEEGRDRDLNKARITASLCSHKPKSLELQINNISKTAEARDIQCLFDGVAAGSPDSPRQPRSLKLLPTEAVRTWYGFPSKEKSSSIVVTWEDDSGELGEYKFEISI